MSSRKVVFAVFFIILMFLPFAVRSSYQLHMIIMTCINIMLGLSFAMLYTTGLLTMGVAAFWAVGAYSSALLVMKASLSFWAALPLSGLVAAFVALCTGSIIVRVPGVPFLVLSMVLNIILPELLGHFDFFGGWAGILGIPGANSIGPLVFVRKTHYYYLAILLLLLNVIGFSALYSSRVGRAWRSVRLNPLLAQATGINLYGYRLLAFIVSSASAGLAGSFYAHYFRSLEPGTFSVFKSINVQVFSILGGLGYSIIGPAIGAVIMTFVPELLRVSKDIEPVITGAVLVLLVIFLPWGILSLPERLRYFRSKSAGRIDQSESRAQRGSGEGVKPWKSC